jgi:aminoglycoside/choline kinase family phosphotransferase
VPFEPEGWFGGFTIIGTRARRFGGTHATARTVDALATADSPNTDSRLQSLNRWIESIRQRFGLEPASLAPASNDASFRRYFRIRAADATRIIMDAPPPREDCRPFVHAARVLGAAGVTVPVVLAADIDQGFLLLDDFGDTTYLGRLDAQSAPSLYRDACQALVRLQTASAPGVFPDYSRELLTRELMLFPEWYLGRHKGIELSAAQAQVMHKAFGTILQNNLSQPAVFVHRDYHSRNLMVLPGEANPGILDFQDAVHGPITYDLVSLLRDAYIQWDEQQVLDWAIRYWEMARKAGLPVSSDFSAFYRDFEWMGLQRHLKVLGIFARLRHRDGKDNYLKDMPLVLDYVLQVLRRYVDLRPLARLVEDIEHRKPLAGYTF